MARQLVNAKLAETDLRRKLRVASRAEVALRDELATKERRLREARSAADGRSGGEGQGGEGRSAAEVGREAVPGGWSAGEGAATGGAPGALPGGLRAQLARACVELEEAKRELALERASGGGAERDVDLQQVLS